MEKELAMFGIFKKKWDTRIRVYESTHGWRVQMRDLDDKGLMNMAGPGKKSRADAMDLAHRLHEASTYIDVDRDGEDE